MQNSSNVHIRPRSGFNFLQSQIRFSGCRRTRGVIRFHINLSINNINRSPPNFLTRKGDSNERNLLQKLQSILIRHSQWVSVYPISTNPSHFILNTIILAGGVEQKRNGVHPFHGANMVDSVHGEFSGGLFQCFGAEFHSGELGDIRGYGFVLPVFWVFHIEP